MEIITGWRHKGARDSSRKRRVRGHRGDAGEGGRALLCPARVSEGQGEWGLTPPQCLSMPRAPPQGLGKVPM